MNMTRYWIHRRRLIGGFGNISAATLEMRYEKGEWSHLRSEWRIGAMKAGLSEYDYESKTWRIVEICDERIAMKRSMEREIETGEPCGVTLYGKNDIPQIGERVWPADHD